MRTWAVILLTVILALAAIVGLAALWGAVLIAAGKRYAAKRYTQDVEEIARSLPGTDCKACGCDSCRAFAEKAAEELRLPDSCPHLSRECRERLEARFEAWKTKKQ